MIGEGQSLSLKQNEKMEESTIVILTRIEGGNEPPAFKALFDDFRLTDEDTEGILRKVHLETHEYKLWKVHHEGWSTAT
jgi:hypothetical protein